ncbi:hypothetical protein ABVT39_019368, partial [Epinephelus coioides]
SKGKYEVVTGVLKSPDELVDLYQILISKYPAVVALIDPLGESLSLFSTNPSLAVKFLSLLSSSCHFSKTPSPPPPLHHLHQDTDCLNLDLQRRSSLFRSPQDSLPSPAVGLDLDYIQLGGLSGAERMTKYNRLISIEEELAQQGILVSKERHPLRLFTEKLQEQSATARAGLAIGHCPVGRCCQSINHTEREEIDKIEKKLKGAAAAGNDGGGGCQQVDEAKGRQEEEETRGRRIM